MGKKKLKPALPDTIYVHWEEGASVDDDYLSASDTPDDLEDGQVVGVYELRRTRVMKVTKELK